MTTKQGTSNMWADSDEALEAQANVINMQIQDEDSEPAKKKAPRDYQQEVAKLRSALKEAERKIANLQVDVRVYRDKVPECLQKTATQMKEEVLYVCDFLAEATGGLLQPHNIYHGIKYRTLAMKNGKLITQ